jgi:nitroreductase
MHKTTATESPATPAEILEQLMVQRFSCRGFLDRMVDEDTLAKILAMAQRTPSWSNVQPWKLIVTREAATERFRNALYAEAVRTGGGKSDFAPPSAYNGEYQLRRRECGLALYQAVGVARGDREASAKQGLENFRFFGAPHVAVITSDAALGVYGAVDCGAYVANFMLAARSLGVATIAQAALALQADFIREYFGLPADRAIVCGISFGYEDPNHPANSFRTSRADWRDEVTLLSQ